MFFNTPFTVYKNIFFNQIKHTKMKNLNTKVSTGDKVSRTFGSIENVTGTIGAYKNGNIKIQWAISQVSCISQFISTRELNKSIKAGTIKIS